MLVLWLRRVMDVVRPFFVDVLLMVTWVGLMFSLVVRLCT